MANYPTSFDPLPEPDYSKKMNQTNPVHSGDHQAVRETVRALQVKVGKDNDTNPDSIDKRVYELEQTPGIGPHPTGAGLLEFSTGLTIVQGISQGFVIQYNQRITGISLSCAAAGTGTLMIDVLKNGISIFTSNDKPEIAPGNTVSLADAIPNVFSLVPGDLIQIQVLTVGGQVGRLYAYIKTFLDAGNIISDLDSILIGTSASFPSGDQTPNRYFTASTTGTISWATISGGSDSGGIIATIKKNGIDMWATSTKPAVPGGGGISAELPPDDGSFHLTDGDYITLNLTGGTVGPVLVTLGFIPD